MSEWIALSERKPTEKDANKHGRVLALFDDGVSITIEWNSEYSSWTHWMPVPPPPKPAMPERLEFVKCKPEEACGEGGIVLHNTKGNAVGANTSTTPESTHDDYTLYRRVATTKRIVFEVTGEERSPRYNEHYVKPIGCVGVALRDGAGPRSILRLVEGAEYLK